MQFEAAEWSAIGSNCTSRRCRRLSGTISSLGPSRIACWCISHEQVQGYPRRSMEQILLLIAIHLFSILLCRRCRRRTSPSVKNYDTSLKRGRGKLSSLPRREERSRELGRCCCHCYRLCFRFRAWLRSGEPHIIFGEGEKKRKAKQAKPRRDPSYNAAANSDNLASPRAR